MREWPGVLLLHRVLGEHSLYRVVSRGGGLVELEVVSAPGLEPGGRVRVTDTAVNRMTMIEASTPEMERPHAATGAASTVTKRRSV